MPVNDSLSQSVRGMAAKCLAQPNAKIQKEASDFAHGAAQRMLDDAASSGGLLAQDASDQTPAIGTMIQASLAKLNSPEQFDESGDEQEDAWKPEAAGELAVRQQAPASALPQKTAEERYEIDVRAERLAIRKPWETVSNTTFSAYVDTFKFGKQNLPLAVMLYETSGLRQLPEAIVNASPEEFKEIGAHLIGSMLADSVWAGELVKDGIIQASCTEERLRRIPRLFEAHRNTAALLSAAKILRGPAPVRISARQVNLATGPQQVNNTPKAAEEDRPSYEVGEFGF